jgi:thiol-disulfide isomerase/thioredoxin
MADMKPTDPPPPPSAGRRRLLYAGVAGIAGLAGAGMAWRKWRPDSSQEDAAAALWPLEFETPVGSILAMKTLRGNPLLVNFWATWCPPCIEELPLLDQFYRDNVANSWQVVGLAIDQPSAVRSFLQRMPISFPVGLAGLGGTELSKALGNLAGALPYTVVISGSGETVQRKMGRVTAADLAQWVKVR